MNVMPRMQIRPLATALLCGVVALGMAVPSRADIAADFLKQLEGSWRGRGAAIIPGRQESERITCQVTNSYAEGKSELKVAGECASTLGKTPVNGLLIHVGTNISGTLLNAFKGATVTKSVGTVSAEALEVSSNFVDNITGNLTRTRQIIRKSANGFEADFFTFDNASGEFKPAGSLVFVAQ